MTAAQPLLASAFAALLLLAPCPANAFHRGGPAYYRSTDGQTVHRPTRGATDFGRVTATCRDGSNSFSHHHQGTCSHHGGVRA